MTRITDLAARKAYLLGQLNEVDGTESYLGRNQQMLKLFREFKQVDEQLEEAYAEAEVKKSQLEPSEPGVSAQEGTSPAALTASKDEADNVISNHPSPDKLAALSLDAAPSKAAPRKVSFRLPEASEHGNDGVGSETSSTSRRVGLPGEPLPPADPDDPEAFFEYIKARHEFHKNYTLSQSSKFRSLGNGGDDTSAHRTLPRHEGSQGEIEGSRTFTGSREEDSI